MNAMAALYHIPQNDAPTLADAHWSNDFRSFVETCLIKDPEHRPNATQAMTVCTLYSMGIFYWSTFSRTPSLCCQTSCLILIIICTLLLN